MWFSVYLLWLQHFDEKKRKNTNQYGFSFSLTWPQFWIEPSVDLCDSKKKLFSNKTSKKKRNEGNLWAINN